MSDPINIADPGESAAALTAALSTLVGGSVGQLLALRLFSTGSHTYTKTPGTRRVLLLGIAPGAGGGGVGSSTGSKQGGSASAGETRIGVFDVSAVDDLSVSVPSPGVGVSGEHGTSPSGDATFGSLMTCKPGKHGTRGVVGDLVGVSGAAHDAGSGGSALPVSGVPITRRFAPSATIMGRGGSPALLGQGEFTDVTSTSSESLPGAPGSGYGAGGAGASSGSNGSAQPGGNGAPGLFLVLEFGDIVE